MSVLGKLIKKLITSLVVLLLITLTVGCSKSHDETSKWQWSTNIARQISDDGWVYTFDYMYLKDGMEDETLIPFAFYGINLRYRYNDNYCTKILVKEEQGYVEKEVYSTIQILGTSKIAQEKEDMEYINNILRSSTKEQLLELDSEDVELNYVNEEMLFELMNKALTGKAHQEGNYGYIPSYALLSEPEYTDGYKYQIGFVNSMGCIDVIFIDVLYETGEGIRDYVQLSDLVDDKTATEKQKCLYKEIVRISEGIVRDNDLLYDRQNIEGIYNVELTRLYKFLQDIENNNIEDYIVSPG